MSAERDARLYELFVAAVARPAAERDALLQQACGNDPTLYAEVVKLLGQHDESTGGPFLATPPVAPQGPGDATALIGRRAGPYELREHLADGGMGRVYRAARVDDFTQSVAVKILRPGLFSDSAGWRFRQERQVLASLDHPHIARLLDGGVTDDGHPYLAMEFVDGRPIDRYCDEAGLSLRQRLELFRQVCLAVHHAHQRLVIHRDLKPANVLVTADGQPKVLDFGIARPLGDSPSASGTHTGQVLGTPAYMSPEQAAGDREAHDIRTDVYALGVIGYELLAGRLPYDLNELPLLEQLLAVVQQEPTPLGQVNPACRGELETVFARALEKDKARRYTSASDLAEDVERFLTHRPILAKPPRLLYVAGKFVRRNRALVAGLTATLVALAVGAVATGVAWDRARKERDANERLLIEARLQQARLQVQRGEWEPALENFDMALVADLADRARVRLERAKVLGVLQRAAEAERELELLAGPEAPPDVRAAALLGLGDLRLGLFADEAVPLVQRAQNLGLTNPADREFAAGLLAETSEQGLTHFRAAVKAEPAHRRANEMLFLTLLTLGRRAEASERLAVLQAVFPRDGTTALCSALLAVYDPDPAALQSHLEACRVHLGPDDHRILSLALTKLRESLAVDFGSNGGNLLKRAAEEIAQLSGEALRLIAHRPADGGGRRLALPPALQRSVGRLLEVLLTDPRRLIEALESATVAHPEGTLFYILGRLHYDRGDYRQARVALQKAVETPSFFPVRRAALESLLDAEFHLRGGPHAFTADQRPRLLGQLRALAGEGGIRLDFAGNLTQFALALGDRELALSIAVEKQRQSPKDPIAQGAVGTVEMSRGNNARAVEQFERALALGTAGPDTRDGLQRALEIARQRLREQAARLAP